MTTYVITGPDGKEIEIDGPPNASREDVIAAIKRRTPGAGGSKSESMVAAPKTAADNLIDQRGLGGTAELRGQLDQLNRMESASTAPAKSGLDKFVDEQGLGGLRDQLNRMVSAAKDIPKSKTSVLPALGLGETAMSLGTGIGSTILGGIAGAGRTLYNLPSEGLDKATELGSKTIHDTQKAFTYQPRTPIGKLAVEAASLPFEVAKYTGRGVGGDIGQVVGGDKGRLVGEAIGNVAPDVAAVYYGGRSGMGLARDMAEREKVPVPGRDFTPLRDLSPIEMERLQRMTDKGIEPTLGQVTRDPQQFRWEDQTGKTREGAPLRTRELDNNDAILNSLAETDTLRAGRSTAENTREAGGHLARTLEENAQESMRNVADKYKAANDAGETRAVVDTAKLDAYLAENAAESIAVPALKSIAAKLETLREMRDGKLTIADLESVYQAAGQLGKDAQASHFMGQVKGKINEITEGAGGNLYREARAARLEHALEYEDRLGISRLIEKRDGSRTDYKTAAEDVVNKTLINGSFEQLSDVINSLLRKGGTNSLQAVRNLQAEAVRYLSERSNAKGVPNERGVNGVSAPELRQGISAIGRDKLELLLGEHVVQRLDNILQATKEVTQAPGKVRGSDTNILNRDFAQKELLNEAKAHLLEKIPGVSAVVRYMDRKKAAENFRNDMTDALYPRRESTASILAQRVAAQREQRRQLYTDTADLAFESSPMLGVASDQAYETQNQQSALARRVDQQRRLSSIGQARTVDEAIQAAGSGRGN